MNRREMPVNIRNHIANFGDPYLPDLDTGEVAVCRECRSVYANHRWELESQAAQDVAKAKHVIDTLCPACQKIGDRVPGGVVSISGRFVDPHKDDIANLVRHENDRAMELNPLERVMDIESTSEGFVILTTNERLAQRIGRAIHKAYSGDVEYKWSEDDKLARVNWHRD
jgi:NMD protein affecting ribosome stability and mRNA decay